ncbi:DUF3231 family protein [Bacillus sp. FSL K6-3431]|uniref:DUF3231 family protein n=1 Tax=Bacillus sp. FSL K6-3431 TaxID=2921500 RepID=UPI0030F8EDD7
MTGLSQIAQSKEVRKYVTKGSEVATHHSAVFRNFLEEGNMPAPVPWSLTVTTSKEPVFSNKLIMFHTAALKNAGIGFYGESLSGSLRRDLSAAYARLIIEVGELGTEGANIMISNGWFEKPQSAPDRKSLAKG